MGLTADIYDIFGFTNHVISEAAALQASITDVTTAVNHFAALLDNQSGATVVSMRNYITGFASSIQAIADAVNMAFMQILMVYQGAYALLDSDAYAVIDEDTISEVLNAYRNSYLWMDDELDIVKEMYYRVCGFTDVTMPSFENAFTRIEEFEAREREYRQALLDTEESFDANELVLLQNLTESSLTYLTGLMPQGYNAVTAPPNVKINGVTDISASLAEREQQIQDVWAHGFVAGANNTACLQITNNPELYNSILGIYGYMMQNEETINGLSEISRDTCETYITDAKWEEGWKKIATGAFALMSGAGALGVAIGEAGTLLTVLGFASGGSSLLFGTSELFEGTQDVSISVQGLKYTDAINPLKDLMGEEAYNKALAISTTTADVVCLAGAVKNTVKGIRDAKAAKGMPEEVPKIEKTDLAEIEKQADLEGEFYEDIFESQRADIPEYEDYLSNLAEAQSDYVKPAGGRRGDYSNLGNMSFEDGKQYSSWNSLREEGLSYEQVEKIKFTPKGKKPLPETYLSNDYINNHLQSFKESGAVKIMPNEPTGTIGGKGGTFVMSGDELNEIIQYADGDVSKIETILGLDQGYLGENPVVVTIEDISSIRIPSGNELGAWPEYWEPGGYTSGGVKEAVVNPAAEGTYTYEHLFE